MNYKLRRVWSVSESFKTRIHLSIPKTLPLVSVPMHSILSTQNYPVKFSLSNLPSVRLWLLSALEFGKVVTAELMAGIWLHKQKTCNTINNLLLISTIRSLREILNFGFCELNINDGIVVYPYFPSKVLKASAVQARKPIHGKLYLYFETLIPVFPAILKPQPFCETQNVNRTIRSESFGRKIKSII